MRGRARTTRPLATTHLISSLCVCARSTTPFQPIAHDEFTAAFGAVAMEPAVLRSLQADAEDSLLENAQEYLHEVRQALAKMVSHQCDAPHKLSRAADWKDGAAYAPLCVRDVQRACVSDLRAHLSTLQSCWCDLYTAVQSLPASPENSESILPAGLESEVEAAVVPGANMSLHHTGQHCSTPATHLYTLHTHAHLLAAACCDVSPLQ